MLTAEKRVDSVIRWLERMKKSYSSGRLEAAMMDAECARADLEDFLRRSSVFDDIRQRPKVTVTEKIFAAVRVVILSLVIVMAAVMPISNEKAPAIKEAVIISESEPAKTEQTQKITARPSKTAKPRKSQSERLSLKSEKPEKLSFNKAQQIHQTQQTHQKPEKSVARDKILSLVQTGQRAFKNKN